MRFSEGYASKYKRRTTLNKAQRLIDVIKAAQGRGVKSFVVHGNSGVSVAFAALALHDFDLFLVRKDNDNSHGSPIEGPSGVDMQDYMILDDQVSSGETVRRIIRKIVQLHRASGYKPPVCLGVGLYADKWTRGVNMFREETLTTVQGDDDVPCYHPDQRVWDSTEDNPMTAY